MDVEHNKYVSSASCVLKKSSKNLNLENSQKKLFLLARLKITLKSKFTELCLKLKQLHKVHSTHFNRFDVKCHPRIIESLKIFSH